MKILIYRDYGCADVGPLYEALKSYFTSSSLEIGFTDAAEIKAGVLDKNVRAFFLGGGAGNPFMQKLAGTGNDRMSKTGGFISGFAPEHITPAVMSCLKRTFPNCA